MQEKKGISLIVLVITIIVMIVLAGAIILSLNNAGIIDKSNEAVDLTNLANAREFAQTKWAEAYLETDKTQEALKDYVLDELAEVGITETDYDIVVTTKGVTVNKKGAVQIITFYIGETECQAEEGMTWLKWVSSLYNTLGIICGSEESLVGFGDDEGNSYSIWGQFSESTMGIVSGGLKIVANEKYEVNIDEDL